MTIPGEVITPIEFIERQKNNQFKDVVFWYKGYPIDTIKMYPHSCSLHFYDCIGDSSLVVRDIGPYEHCITVEPIDHIEWRKRLHSIIDKLEDEELYSELIGYI